MTVSTNYQAKPLFPSSIPQEIIVHGILAKLGYRELVQCALTCEEMNELAKHKDLWARLLYRDFEVPATVQVHPKDQYGYQYRQWSKEMGLITDTTIHPGTKKSLIKKFLSHMRFWKK